MGNVLAQLGHGACPTWARCLPRMGRFHVRQLPNKFILRYPYSCFQDSADTWKQKKYRPRIKPERYFFEPYTPASRMRLPTALRKRLPPIRLLAIKPSRQSQTIARPPTACISKHYSKKTRQSDNFDRFLKLLINHLISPPWWHVAPPCCPRCGRGRREPWHRRGK